MTPAAVARTLAALKAAVTRRDRAATNDAVATLLDGGAALGGDWQAIAHLMRVGGEWTLAHRAIDALVAAAPDAAARARALHAKALLLLQSGRPREAHDLLATLPPDMPDRAYLMGHTAMQSGHVEAATGYLLAALDDRPGRGPAWLSLATMLNLADDPVGDRLIADADAATRQPPADAARYLYALGKCHADRGEREAAVAAFARGAALLRAAAPYDRAADAANARTAMTGWPRRFPPAPAPGSGRPIFVTGLPRSGTTLVEQILASHGAVADGGELNLVQHLAVAAGGVSGDHLTAFTARGGRIEQLGDLYLHLLAERCGPRGRIVDKTLDISRCLGLIASALPDAPLIWLRRDPLDNAWSAFRTFFVHGSGWSYDLADIAHHFALEDELLAWWRPRLGARLLVIPYDGLVTDPAGWTARLLAHCGLADEPGVHAPHLTKRAVTSASTAQVRRPINRDGLGVATPYRAFLQPFVDAYGPAA